MVRFNFFFKFKFFLFFAWVSFFVFCVRSRYVTAEELLAQQEEEAKGRGETAAAAPKQIIVDMRGPQVTYPCGIIRSV